MMRAYFVISLLLLSFWATAQTTELPDGLNFSILWTDYNSLDSTYQGSNEGRFLHPKDVNYALAIGYQHAINASFNVGGVVRLGSIDSHHSTYKTDDPDCQPCSKRIRQEFFVSGAVLGRYKFANGYLLPENFVLRPYIFAGVSLVHMTEHAIKPDLQLPVGLGFEAYLAPLFALHVQGEYRKSLLIVKDNLALSVGITCLFRAE